MTNDRIDVKDFEQQEHRDHECRAQCLVESLRAIAAVLFMTDGLDKDRARYLELLATLKDKQIELRHLEDKLVTLESAMVQINRAVETSKERYEGETA